MTSRVGRRYLWWLSVLGGAAFAVAGWWIWRTRSPRGTDRPLVILISGDTAGWIVPCGCASNQSGGLLRRATYAADLRKRVDLIVADVGGAPGGTSPYQRVKFEAILDGELAMGIAAHNIGGPEADLGVDYLRQLIDTKKVPFISANLRDADGEPVADLLRIVEIADRRVALAGVLSPQYAAAGMQITDPKTALLGCIAEAGDRYDTLVVLAYLPEDELHELAGALPEADVIVGGPTGQSIPPRTVGQALLTSATNKGKFLVRLETLPQTPDLQWTAYFAEMGPDLTDHPNQLDNLQHYLDELARRDFKPRQTGLVAPTPPGIPESYRIAGNRSCLECHEEDCRLWEESKHAEAWQVLEEQGKHVDPACQQCHTTGYGLPGGFASVRGTAARRAVGCENCHGPSAAHVDAPSEKTPFDAGDQCIRCHDHENSPEFDYDEYWQNIHHGDEEPKDPDRSPAATRTEAKP